MADASFPLPQPTLTYGVVDAARALGIGRSSIYRLIADGKLEARALGGRTVIPAKSMHAFVASLPSAPIKLKSRAGGDR